MAKHREKRRNAGYQRFLLSHNVFKRHLFHGRYNLRLCAKDSTPLGIIMVIVGLVMSFLGINRCKIFLYLCRAVQIDNPAGSVFDDRVTMLHLPHTLVFHRSDSSVSTVFKNRIRFRFRSRGEQYNASWCRI